MEVKAKLKYLRIAPRKARLVATLIRGKKTDVALDQLRFTYKRSALPIEKLIKSAIANAINNYNLSEDNLFVKEISVDGGPILHRWLPRAQGRATPINKHTSHINLVLAEIKDSGVKTGKKPKTDKLVKLDGKPKEDEGIKISKTDKTVEVETKEVDKEIVDPRAHSRGGHARIEGGSQKGFTSRMFRRKSG